MQGCTMDRVEIINLKTGILNIQKVIEMKIEILKSAAIVIALTLAPTAFSSTESGDGLKMQFIIHRKPTLQQKT